jgi:uncharacterized protein (TIGR02722 family)
MKTATASTRALTALLSLTLLGCSSMGYQNPSKSELVTIDFGSTDLQTLAGDMMVSLEDAPALMYMENPGKDADKRVILFIGDVENRTAEHIDTAAITDKIQTQLFKNGKFRLVAGKQGQAQISDQVRFQQSGAVREEMMRTVGRQLGADVVLYGSLRSIDKKRSASLESAGRTTRDKYYQFILRCVNIETAEILWQNEVELRKRSKTGIFGR